MSGKLIFVSGLTGAGKTTLVGKALANVNDLEVLLTYVTRPPRAGEEESYEYVFVSDEEYELAKSKSTNWDETVFNSIKYGSDAEAYIRDLKSGTNVIVAVTPSLDDISSMTKIYGLKPVTVWIDTPREICEARVKGDTKRASRIEDETVKEYFNILFTPSNNLIEDSTSFIKLIESIID